MIVGLNHITLSVRDLHQSFEFYKEILRFKPLMRSSRIAYFLAGDLWFCLDQDPKVRAGALPEYTHIAFSAEQSLFKDASARIQSNGVQIWKENESEGDSIYFLDPNGHKLELHVGDWRTRIEDAKENPWDEDMEFFV